MERKTLFTPGPVMTTAAVKAALAHPDMPHRRPAFSKVFASAVARIKPLCGADDSYDVAIITGSGSAANECALSSLVRPAEKILIISNGSFGERLEDMATCYGLNATVVRTPWGHPPDLAAVEQALVADPGLTWVFMVLHETGSGILMPVATVGAITKRLGRRLFVDAVSAFGAEDIHLVRDNVDVMTGVGNKAVGGITGISFVVARRDAVPELGSDMPRRNVYLNLQNHLRWSREHHQTPNTPAVTALVALDAALAELETETLPGRRARYLRHSNIIRKGLADMGLRFLLDESLMATALTSAYLPPPVTVDAFIDQLDERGFVVYPGKGVFHDQNVFQVATMGALTDADCHALLDAIRESITELQRQAA